MRRRRRDRIEILAEILRAARTPDKQTRVMYEVAISYDPFMVYLGKLIDLGLIEVLEDPGGGRRPHRYRTTSSGEELLKRIDEVYRTLRMDA